MYTEFISAHEMERKIDNRIKTHEKKNTAEHCVPNFFFGLVINECVMRVSEIDIFVQLHVTHTETCYEIDTGYPRLNKYQRIRCANGTCGAEYLSFRIS